MTEPHFGVTKQHGFTVHARVTDHLPEHSAYARFNKKIALTITRWVGSMTCAYTFGLLALVSLPAVLTAALHVRWFPGWLVAAGLIALVSWLAQTFLQLVLLSVILVGSNVSAAAGDARAAKTFEDTEIIADRLDLDTPGGLAAVHADVKDARAAAEAAAEAAAAAAQALAMIAKPAPRRGVTPMQKKATGKDGS